ncbi:UNVERIFIED_CONTAM: hypothetical protein Sradi_0213000 [Sesamum radiatum]|uniref:Endonuclease/exonuclease/phosphatase domain-containing protein n=1 Tax=Sesamum radiatum TaxID=300843 RepID=A0AAW2W1C4_SESRA
MVNYNGIGVDSVRKGGGLMMLYHKDVDVWLQSFSTHHIDVTVKSEGCHDCWRFNGFYGYPEVARRKEGWALLRRLLQLSARPWLYARDFNEVLDQHKKEGTLPRAMWQIRDFRECLCDFDLQDIGFEGDKFTWCNHRVEPFTVRARLDRVCSDSNWANMFPSTTIMHEVVSCSDHSALWIDLEGEQSRTKTRCRQPFRFEAAWTTTSDCVDVVRQAWCSTPATNSGQGLTDKIRASRMHLTQWNNGSFGNIRRKTREISAAICKLQEQPITASCKSKIENLKDTLEKLAVQEEIL